MDKLPSAELFRRYRNGSSRFANEIYDRYIERLLGLVRRHLSKQLQRRSDEEDVVQSAFHSFFRRARGDQFRIVATKELWRLLAGITMNKLRRQVEIHRAAKRTPQRETCDAETTEGWELPPDVGLVDAVCLTEQLELALDDCTLDERMVLLGSLQGKESGRLSEELQKSERTIRRWLSDARRKVERRLLSEASNQAQREVPDVGSCRYEEYHLERILGSGGMGRVYLAREKRTGRCFALKATQSSSAAVLVGGTLGYSAPELASGASIPTISSDIYAYGKLLHDLVDATKYGSEEIMVPMTGPCRSLTELANACADERPEVRVSSAAEIRGRLRQIVDRT